MKSYFLEGLTDGSAADAKLASLLPGQTKPSVLLADAGDAIAYFNSRSPGTGEDALGPFLIQADISGRHYNDDETVLRVLRRIQQELGGQIRDDDDNLI